jgi:hypothetical protein
MGNAHINLETRKMVAPSQSVGMGNAHINLETRKMVAPSQSAGMGGTPTLTWTSPKNLVTTTWSVTVPSRGRSRTAYLVRHSAQPRMIQDSLFGPSQCPAEVNQDGLSGPSQCPAEDDPGQLIWSVTVPSRGQPGRLIWSVTGLGRGQPGQPI